MALAGVAVAAETPVAVWTLDDVSLSGNTNYTTDANNVTLSSLNISGDNGYTVMITMNWTKVSNAPVLWFSTTDGTGYANSTATFGYKGGAHHACLFNTSGSNGHCVNSYTGTNDNLPDYLSDDTGITGTGGNDANVTSLKDKTLTYFITSLDGNTKLYELLNDGNVTLIATQSGMKTGTLDTLVVGHWNGANAHQDGTMDIQLYSSVLEVPQMKALTVPEPTTATLSLLALAGLAARRRRK